MALVAIKCTQCGADLQMDDQKEIGYCLNCGSRIMLHETINIKHSGSVRLDNSDNASNCLRLAEQAYSIGNYLEAYNYFTKVLEYDSNSYYATFKKGMSAARSSPMGDIKYKDLIQGYTLADRLLQDSIRNQADERTRDLLSQDHRSMTTEMKDFALNIFENTEIPPPGTTFESNDDCGLCIYIILDTLLLLENVCSVIDPVIYEDYRKILLEKMIGLCDKMPYYYLKYLSGYSVDKNGRQIPQYQRYFIPDKAAQRFKACRAECVNAFNNLPSNVSALNNLTEQLQALANEKAAGEAEMKQLGDIYKINVQAFWKENAEMFTQYKKTKNITWFIVLGGVGACAILVVVALLQKADMIPYGIGGGAAAAVSVLLKLKIAKKAAAKFEDKVFPEELKQKNNDFKAAVTKQKEKVLELKKKEQEKKGFEATLKR